ncbi:putative glucosylceramidase 4 [Centruroides sculpturatus]|uniref:putative glucosylceramidase 4 n=1 Tax=Centruroides sculpturatus TaxID=218467 RepID=UPI000C6EA664|nr:putative glucosylceramidase 4 [Centruroides sculpturatus]
MGAYGRLRLEISIDRTKRYQEILGFGGAFTDAAGINILSLPEQLQDQILRGYYSSDGLDYTFGRVPIASCDFSTHVYSYDDVPGDANLTHFSLTEEDSKLKIPLIHRAQKMQSKSIKLFASPWSAPGWMKSSRKMGGPGILKEEYYQTWAEYFVNKSICIMRKLYVMPVEEEKNKLDEPLKNVHLKIRTKRKDRILEHKQN